MKEIERDFGGGFYTVTEYEGRSAWYNAYQLDAPGGYVLNGRSKKFSYQRDAEAQIAAWRAEDARL